MHTPNKICTAKGFTLIELMITVAILAIVAGIAIPAYNGHIRNARLSECATEVGTIKLAQSEFFLENNAYFPAAGSSVSTIPAIESASEGIYVSSYTVAGTSAAATSATTTNIGNANCTYTVSSTAAPSYTVTATGQNLLSTADTFTQTN